MTRAASLRPPCAQSLRHRFGAGIVKPKTIDDCVILGHPKHARRRIAWLRMPGYAPEFTKTKTECVPSRQCSCILIHSGCQAYWIGKAQSEQFNGQFRGFEKRSYDVTAQFATAHP